MAKAVQTQLELKTQCEQVQQSLKGLYDWEQEIKQKEAQNRHQQQQQEVEGEHAPPVRSRVDEMLKFVADQNAKEKTELTPPSASSTAAEFKEAERFNAIGNTFHKRAKNAAEEFSFHKENNDQNAIEMYTKAIEINDRDPTYFLNRAHCLFNLERYEECIADCASAIALDSECANAYYRRMQAYEYLGNNEQAYSDCSKILKISMDRNQIARTKQDMERIEKRLKKEADIIKEQGNKHWSAKEYEKGRQCFSKAISLYGNDPIYYYNRSLCNFYLKDYDACAKDCDRAIELDKDYFRPYYQRMRVRELRADYLGAINDCQTYLKLVKNEKQRLTAEKDLERLQLTLKNEQQPKAYNWNELRKNASLVSFVNKAPHLRSKKPLKRIAISEASSAADSKENASNYVIASNYEAIPDAVIDKIFNNNTGERVVEPKPEPSNLESLFPASSNKLKQYFSPPVTPSSPPKETFRKEAGDPPQDNKSQETKASVSRVENTANERKEDVVSHAKKGKDLINKGTVSFAPLFSFVKASAGIFMAAVLDLVRL
uniref:Putative rna polymerase ii-associated protein 3 n=1 Tax=Culex tarsalis TaxID=7177 RepID=A0A1Q3F6B5_CULTA